MSYMRGTWYIYSSGDEILINGPHAAVSMPKDIALAFAAMHWHRVPPEERRATLERIYEEYAGNWGADGIAAELGRPSVMDMVRADIGAGFDAENVAAAADPGPHIVLVAEEITRGLEAEYQADVEAGRWPPTPGSTEEP